jgi:hypothetical protein
MPLPAISGDAGMTGSWKWVTRPQRELRNQSRRGMTTQEAGNRKKGTQTHIIKKGIQCQKRQVKEKTKENQSHGKKKKNRGKHNPHDKAYFTEHTHFWTMLQQCV